MKNIFPFLLLTSLVLIAAFKLPTLKDGTYKGISQSRYTDEPYFGLTIIEVKNGVISRVQFSIRDSAKHVTFDQNYEQYFANDPLYIQQCRKDLNGAKAYPDSLLKHQNLQKIDAISGATWSCNLFKASAQMALEQAYN